MTSGLRRFRTPAAVPGRTPRPRSGERCEMCAEAIGDEHPHVVNLESRAILCTCRGCYLLFDHPGATSGKYRAVPDRYRYVPSLRLAAAMWESSGIPVGMAFLFINSSLGKTVAFYPSPAGATESMLPLDTWTDLLSDNPELADVEPDIEAILINKVDEAFEGFLVPIVTCYELVGMIRLKWRGFDGGAEAREAIEGFFDGLRKRGRLAGRSHA